MSAPDRIWADGDASCKYDAEKWDWSGGCWGRDPEREGEVEYIRADLVPQWQPIETAPKDGTAILSTWHSLFKYQDKWFIQPVFFRDGIWLHLWDHDETLPLNPTHWQPLPSPPPAS